MSGSIQPISTVSAPAVQQPAAVPIGERGAAPPEPLPSPQSPPSAAAAVELQLSEFARALEKLAQNPAIDPRLLAQLAGITHEQGELIQLLQMLGGATAGGPSAQVPEGLGPLATVLKGLAATQAQEQAPAGSSSVPAIPSEPQPNNPAPAPGLVQEFQERLTQSLSQLAASIKGALGPALEGVLSTPAATTPAGLKPEAQAIPSAPQGSSQSNAQLTPNNAQPSSSIPNSAFPIPHSEAALVADALRTLQAAGKLAEAPLIRQEFIKASLGVVATLLNDPVFTEAAQRRGREPARTAPVAESILVKLDPALRERIQSVLKELAALKPLMTPGGRDTWVRVEAVLGELAKAGEPTKSGAKPSAQLAELARRGLIFDIELRDSPRLEAAVAELRDKGIRAEVIRIPRSRLATVRVTLPGSDSPAEPVRIGPAEAAPAKKASAAARGEQATPTAGQGAPAGQPASAPAEAFARLTFGAGRESSAEDNDPAARARFEQYNHPEALHLHPQAQQDAVMIQMVAFFQTRREAAIRGQRFEASHEQQAAPELPPWRMLEYKPVEVLRPGVGVAFDGDMKAGDDPTPPPDPPVIDIDPVRVRRA